MTGLAALMLATGCGDGGSTVSTQGAIDSGSMPNTAAASESSVNGADLDGFAIQIRPVVQGCFEVVPGTSGGKLPVPTFVPEDDTALVSFGGGTQYCRVGPAQADGTVFETDATAQLDPTNGWVVTAALRPGAAGEDQWNAIAAQCYERVATCPTGQLAIVVSGVAVSVATIQVPEFKGTVQISGSFTEAEARELARQINAASR